MMDKETWKIETDRDKMKKLIKYHMHVQYHKKHLFEKEKLSQVTVKQSTVFFLWMIAFKTPTPDWEIQTDWENDV